MDQNSSQFTAKTQVHCPANLRKTARSCFLRRKICRKKYQGLVQQDGFWAAVGAAAAEQPPRDLTPGIPSTPKRELGGGQGAALCMASSSSPSFLDHRNANIGTSKWAGKYSQIWRKEEGVEISFSA